MLICFLVSWSSPNQKASCHSWLYKLFPVISNSLVFIQYANLCRHGSKWFFILSQFIFLNFLVIPTLISTFPCFYYDYKYMKIINIQYFFYRLLRVCWLQHVISYKEVVKTLSSVVSFYKKILENHMEVRN